MYICVDFDGTVVEHKYPEVGKDVYLAAETLKELINNGHNIILFTMRDKKELQDAINWFYEREINLFGINTNPTQHTWTSSPKAYGHMYIDDAALGCPLLPPKTTYDRPYVDWEKINNYFKTIGII